MKETPERIGGMELPKNIGVGVVASRDHAASTPDGAQVVDETARRVAIATRSAPGHRRRGRRLRREHRHRTRGCVIPYY